MPKHITVKVSPIEDIETAILRLRTALKNADIFAICRKKRYFEKPSKMRRDAKRVNTKRSKKRYAEKPRIRELSDTKIVEFNYYERHKYV